MSDNDNEGPTCQSILNDLQAHGKPLLKTVLTVDKYTALIKFINEKIKDCTAKERKAASELLQEIINHAKANNAEPEIIEQSQFLLLGLIKKKLGERGCTDDDRKMAGKLLQAIIEHPEGQIKSENKQKIIKLAQPLLRKAKQVAPSLFVRSTKVKTKPTLLDETIPPPPPEERAAQEQTSPPYPTLLDLRVGGKWSKILRSPKGMTESTKKEVLSFDVTDPSGKMRKQYYIPLIIDIGEKKEIVNVLVRFSTHAVDFSIPTDIYDVDKTRLEAITKGLFRFMKVEEQDNLENLIAFGVRGSPVHKHEILTALAQQRISSKLQTASSSEPAFPLPPAAGSNIRLPPLPDAAEPLLSPESPDERPIDKTRKFGNEANIWLYKSTNESAEPTCRSILEKLSQEEGPLLKMHLTVYVSSDEKDGLGSDEKYEKLLFFIEEKLNANNCPPEEYAAGHKLLEAIKVHATAKDKQKVVKWVEQTVFKVDNLLAEYDRFKLSHPNLNFKGTKGLLRFLLSSNGIKSRNRKLDKVRMEQVRDICAGMLSIEGMTVDAVLDMAIKLVSETNEPEKKQQVLADTKFMLLQWKKLDLSDTAKNRIGINNYKSNDKYIKLKFEVDRNANDPMLPPAPSPFDGFEVPPPPPLEDGNEPPPPPSEGIYSNLPTKTMLQVFLEIDTAINHEAILNSPHILGLTKQLFNDFAEVYSKIKQDEFYGEEGGPNLNKFDDFFTQLTDSVEMNVLNAKNEEAIKNRALFYLKLAETCFDAGNLQAAQAILMVFETAKMSPISREALKSYKNKDALKKIQSILLYNESKADEIADEGDERAHKQVAFRQYLKEKTNVACMPSFSLVDRASLGNGENTDYLQHSLNLGKMLRPISKRVALISAKGKTSSKILYTDVNVAKDDKPYHSEVTLYTRNVTCQSIINALKAQGMLPFKGLLNVYALDKQKYGFGEDQKYTLLLDFIEQMIKVKDFPPAEYEAARELLHAIKEHAQNNNKPQIIKRVNSLVTKNLPTVEKAKQKAIEMMADLKKFSGVKLTNSIIENKNYKELKKLINKCTPDEKAAIMNFISEHMKGDSVQKVDILRVILIKSISLEESKSKSNFFSFRKKVLPPQAIPVSSNPQSILPKAQSAVPQPVSVPVSTVSSSIPESLLLKAAPPPLPKFSGRFANLPIKLLDIKLPNSAALESMESQLLEIGPITFIPEKSINKGQVSYSMSPGTGMSGPTNVAHTEAYNALVTSIFKALEDLNPPSKAEKPIEIKLPKELEDNRADGLIEAIQVARLNYPNIHIKFVDQKGELVPKPSSGAEMQAP